MLIGYAITDAVCCLTISLSLAYIFSHVVAHFSLSIFTKLFTKSVRICALDSQSLHDNFSVLGGIMCRRRCVHVSSFFIIYFIFSFCALFSRHRQCLCVHKKIEFFRSAVLSVEHSIQPKSLANMKVDGICSFK